MARKRHTSIIKPGPNADTSCAVCGRPLTLFDRVTALDGRTVCGEDCLGAGILRARQLPEYQDGPPAPPEEAERCGGWCEDDYDG
jgi:hypothetical protein